jgi:Flp pilus assembly protein TadB
MPTGGQIGGPGRSAARSLARLGGAIAWTAAAVAGAVLAVFFAATVVVVGVLGVAVLMLTLAAMRARRTAAQRPADTDIIEAHNVGGHSWVAYGWDSRR